MYRVSSRTFVPLMRDKVTIRPIHELTPAAKARVAQRLRKGDQVMIAEATGASAEYVRKVIKQRRASRSVLARRIWFIGDRIIRDRANLRNL